MDLPITDIKRLILKDGTTTFAYKQGHIWYVPHTIQSDNTHEALRTINSVEKWRRDTMLDRLHGNPVKCLACGETHGPEMNMPCPKMKLMCGEV